MLRITSAAALLALSASFAYAECGGHVTAQSKPATEVAALDATVTAAIPQVKTDVETAKTGEDVKPAE